MNAQCCPLTSPGDDGSEFESTTRPRARKEHTCCECREPIRPGTVHERFVGKFDNHFSSHRTCLSCAEIRDHFNCDGCYFRQLWSDLEEHFFPDMRAGGPCMEGLSPQAKTRLFTRRFKWLQ